MGGRRKEGGREGGNETTSNVSCASLAFPRLVPLEQRDTHIGRLKKR